MDRTKLKNYAPQARREFIQAMVDRAAFYGLTADKTEAVVEKGDVAVIGGRSFPIAFARKRKALEDRIKRHSFQQTMEAMAYTWFNRLVAIRYMELHGYFDHGYRVLSHPEGKPTPEILEHAEHVDFPGLKKDQVIDLKLAGNREGELYRLVLTSQCNALHSAMPFLFERIDDETELLLPENLLNSDSLIRKLVNEIDEADWQEVEIIGWLYQFYISERKDEVIGKVVASEDIPAATQLFTPNWIVKYLVQNTLGRQWLATYPQSALRQQMEYYIEPAEQTAEVQEQLKAITPTSLNPEELTLLDPACGSGHILVEAYDLFKAIYQERGYRAKDIPALILQKNLFGLEIDDRAAQLASFALMMKARADDRRIFDGEAKPNIVAFQDSTGMNAADITHSLNGPAQSIGTGQVSQPDIAHLLELFENAKTFGSLIQIPPKLAAMLNEIEQRLDDTLHHGDLTHAASQVIRPIIRQARLLAKQFDVVVANPPYIGRRYMPKALKEFGEVNYSGLDSDVFSMMILRSLPQCHASGALGFVSPFVWMFISTFSEFRKSLDAQTTLMSLIQLEYNAFEPACVPVCSFTLSKGAVRKYRGDFIKLSDFKGHEAQAPKTLEAIQNPSCGWRYTASSLDMAKIPGHPIAYWVSDELRNAFHKGTPLSELAEPRQGMATADNGRFLRRWFEVDSSRIGFGLPSRKAALESGMRWFPYNKGGDYRRWYGNNEWIVNWENDGHEIKNVFDSSGKLRSRPQNLDYFFLPSLSWSFISSSFFAVRCSDGGFLFDVGGSSAFPSEELRYTVAGFLCSKVAFQMMGAINPTLNFQVGNVASLPVLMEAVRARKTIIDNVVSEAIQIARSDWDASETSWDFQVCPLITLNQGATTIRLSQSIANEECENRLARMNGLEEENNRLFIDAYGVQGQLSPEVSNDQITLYRPTMTEDIKRMLSYTIGCMMGRYSLDEPGLIYAHSGNQSFDASKYKTFRADDDGIIPLLETDWGIRDDATNRFEEFIGVAWPKENLEENLTFVAESLGPNNGEQARETIRRYLATGFYKYHLSMYKKRPIYWLFSSGKQRAFQCLVYLHRYNEGTLARMRTEYVIPLQGQIAARIDQLEGDKAKATSTSHRTKIQKEQDKLKKQQAELATFEEKLKHYADMRISLDLDDGVKVNYANFGDLLAESKAITGGKDDE
jgi:type II restriction/modification system DNA methylase subunit YeeA